MSEVDHASKTETASGPLTAVGISHAVRSFIVLCGAVRRTPLARSIGRSLVDLPLTDGTTLAERHIRDAGAFAARRKSGSIDVRLLVDSESESPREHDPRESVRCMVERDASSIRGVAGVLADATRGCDPNEFVVVVNGAQMFRTPLDELVEAMARKESDVTMVASADGTPVGLWLIRCGVLRTVRDVGYVDLKEQALPEWLGRWKVSVVETQRSYAVRTRTIHEYLGALQMQVNGGHSGSSVDEDPYREDWERSFAVIEPGAEVDASATVHDSVVLSGAKVGRGAVVVRSVVCPGGSVASGQRCVGQVVGVGGRA